ncbi:hypothetical protein KUM42_15350 [Modestobacter sp. L9-4]|uniref:hypothetical protein n=1 Tax=Modestobacter sp. L9-4 TaxID=2851567 RepID=UPI001C74A505|nr:hypothetical protein [Modestobacter sp. L9-4]QXG75203.1 hypothetical protein KUM42_15350 [Modestobacter sp. L9-4]
MKRVAVRPVPLRLVLLFGVLVFVLNVLVNRFLFGDGFDWVKAAVVTVLTSAFVAVFGGPERPRSREEGSDVR